MSKLVIKRKPEKAIQISRKVIGGPYDGLDLLFFGFDCSTFCFKVVINKISWHGRYIKCKRVEVN